MSDHGPDTETGARWLALVRRYYDGCSAGDVALTAATLHPDIEHFFLAPNPGSQPVRGAEHLARYWRKVQAMIDARWVVDQICAAPAQAVIEWTMFWRPQGRGERVATRGAEWFSFEDGLIREIRSYYQMRAGTSELDGFPYAQRGYSVAGAEHSLLHPAPRQQP